MKEILMEALGVIIVVTVMFFVGILFSALFGGVVGWVVGFVFPFVIEALNQVSGLSLTGFEMGATLGFFGAFFRTNVTNKSKD
jgi:hypothetical protein